MHFEYSVLNKERNEAAMSCQWNGKIQALHDGELAAGERASTEAHAASCSECTAELQNLGRMARFLNAAPLPGISELTLARVGERIKAERLNGRRTARLAGWLTAAAALVMATCSAALFSMNDLSGQVRPAPAEGWEQVATTLELPTPSENDDPTVLILDGDDIRE